MMKVLIDYEHHSAIFDLPHSQLEVSDYLLSAGIQYPYGRVSDNIRIKLQFITMGYADHYEALKTTLINNNEGEIDTNVIRLNDIWGVKASANPNFRDGVSPRIGIYQGEFEWYGFEPSPTDYVILAESVDDYLELFSEDIEYGQSMT